jgi:uncharacterized protein (TIGR02145 family)
MKNSVVFASFVFIVLQACHKQEITLVPIVKTTELSDITPSTVKSGGSITTNNGLISWGLCCSTKSNPTINDIMVIDSTHKLNYFAMRLTGLLGNTKYFLRAFAINTEGIGYGNEYSFTTLSAVEPVVSTSDATNITSSTITIIEKLLNTGGADVTEMGVCWGTTANPDLTKNKLSVAVDTSNLIQITTGLNPETTYYLRPYAINNLGTGYGNEISFKTTSNESSVIDIDGNIYSSVKIGDQIWMQQNLKSKRYSNGDPIGTTSSLNLDISDEIAPNYQWAYKGDEKYTQMYGRLYTWYAASDPRNICPTGWHVSTHAEWITLFTYLATNSNNHGSFGGELAKAISDKSGWISSESPYSPGFDQASNNSSGFSGLPGGGRSMESFNYMGYGAYWWSSSDIDQLAWDGCYIWYDYRGVYSDSRGKYQGLSVRCVKNN